MPANLASIIFRGGGGLVGPGLSGGATFLQATSVGGWGNGYLIVANVTKIEIQKFTQNVNDKTVPHMKTFSFSFLGKSFRRFTKIVLK